MRSVIFSQCRDRRMGVVWLNLGALTTARASEFWICWSRVIWHLGRLCKESCSSRAWSEQWKWRSWRLFWYRGMDGYSEADGYGNSKIWRQMRSGRKKWGVYLMKQWLSSISFTDATIYGQRYHRRSSSTPTTTIYIFDNYYHLHLRL